MTDHIEVKAHLTATDAGEITGTAWPFGSADRVGDTILKGAFDQPTSLPMLFAHDQAQVIGVWGRISYTKRQAPRKTRLLVMRPADRALFAALPGSLTIYRGYADQNDEHGPLGFSWTLDRQIASRFAYQWSWLGPPTIATTTVQKAEVLAYFDEGLEQEIVVDPWSLDEKQIEVEMLTQKDVAA